MMMNAAAFQQHNMTQQESSRVTGRGPAKRVPKEADAQEVAGFLLTLKHRSVTPEPPAPGDETVGPTTTHQPRQPLPPPPLTDVAPKHLYEAPMPLSYGVAPSAGYSYPMPSSRSSNCSSSYNKNNNNNNFAQTPALPDKGAPALLEEASSSSSSSSSSSDVQWDNLLGGSELVLPKDRDLVPDALFVAMAQMKICKLTQADRVGCYKSRPIGFTGMSCKHCGGQPGFGRFYPNSVRSLAQTTTSQTILKHVGSKCRYCPPHIRQAVMELQRQQAVKEGVAAGRPRYGSRKIFFQRIWARLHGKRSSTKDEEDETKSVDEVPSHATGSESDDHHGTNSADDRSDEDSIESKNRKRRYGGSLPLQKNLKRRKDAEQQGFGNVRMACV